MKGRNMGLKRDNIIKKIITINRKYRFLKLYKLK